MPFNTNLWICTFTVKEDCMSDGEDDVSTDALVEEMLQQGDTAVIYPEAPEDEPQRQGTPDPSIHDENGTGHQLTAFIHPNNSVLCALHISNSTDQLTHVTISSHSQLTATELSHLVQLPCNYSPPWGRLYLLSVSPQVLTPPH